MNAVPASDRAVVFDDVHMVFQGLRRPVWALRGLSLTVERGTVLGLLGPNGAGKTTAISCCLGLLRPQSGAVHVWGQEVSSSAAVPSCGVLLEDTRLPPFLSVRDALSAVCVLRRMARADQSRSLEAVIAECKIAELLRRSVRALSKGQARRVGLAAALLGDPALLVLDEPSAGLDPDARVDFERIVRGLRGGNRTVVIASHLLGDVEATCSHLAVVDQGRVVLSGKASDLLGDARRGQKSDVHVEAGNEAALLELGMASQPSSYPGLVMIRTELPEVEVFAALARASIVPRRVEPSVSVLSLYLQATRETQHE